MKPNSDLLIEQFLRNPQERTILHMLADAFEEEGLPEKAEQVRQVIEVSDAIDTHYAVQTAENEQYVRPTHLMLERDKLLSQVGARKVQIGDGVHYDYADGYTFCSTVTRGALGFVSRDNGDGSLVCLMIDPTRYLRSDYSIPMTTQPPEPTDVINVYSHSYALLNLPAAGPVTAGFGRLAPAGGGDAASGQPAVPAPAAAAPQ